MPPHNVTTLQRPRTIANVLLDLRQSRREWEKALNDAECADRENNPRLEEAASDRMSEVDARVDELQDEFKALFRAATGVSWEQVQSAIEDAVL